MRLWERLKLSTPEYVIEELSRETGTDYYNLRCDEVMWSMARIVATQLRDNRRALEEASGLSYLEIIFESRQRIRDLAGGVRAAPVVRKVSRLQTPATPRWNRLSGLWEETDAQLRARMTKKNDD